MPVNKKVRMITLRLVAMLQILFLSTLSLSDSHIHAGTALQSSDLRITRNGKVVDLFTRHADDADGMISYRESFRALVDYRESPAKDQIKDFIDKITATSPNDFRHHYSELRRVFLERNSQQRQEFESFLRSFEHNFATWTGVAPHGLRNPRLLFSWRGEFSSDPQSIQLRNRLFPKMHSSRQEVVRSLTRTPAEREEVWKNFARRLHRQGRNRATIMFSDAILSEINGTKLKEIFGEATNGEFILSVSQKVNKIKIDSRKSFQIFEGVDEVDLLVSSREHTATPDLLNGIQDYRSRKIAPNQRALRDALSEWIQRTENPRISFHLFEGDFTMRGEQREIFFRNLEYLDRNEKLRITINHGMTLDPIEVTRLERHFSGRIRVSLQPSTYRILGGKSYPKIAEQFKKLLRSPIRVTIGSDDPGLYTCPVSGECYGDPKAFFKGILEAKNSRGRLIFIK